MSWQKPDVTEAGHVRVGKAASEARSQGQVRQCPSPAPQQMAPSILMVPSRCLNSYSFGSCLAPVSVTLPLEPQPTLRAHVSTTVHNNR